MQYRKYIFTGKPELLSILTAFLFQDGFEGIEEQGVQINAFIGLDHTHNGLSPEVKEFLFLNKIDFQTEIVIDDNWNAIWESSFEPILVDNKCLVRANHHNSLPHIVYDIIINPKMTFGTGHHPTTYLMIKKMLDLDFSNKSVFDFGTGTGVLAILAEKMGAQTIFTNDIDKNCETNTLENFSLNNTSNCQFKLGDIDLIENNKFDIVLANVTRNTILERWMNLKNALKKEGTLIISGFYAADISFFKEVAAKENLKIINTEEKDNWLVIVLKN